MSKSRTKRVPVAEAQEEFLRLYAKGNSVTRCMEIMERSRSGFDQWLVRYPDFALRVEKIESKLRNGGFADNEDSEFSAERIDNIKQDMPSFEEFCLKYLGVQLFTHQLQWIDVLEGNAPRDLHPSMTFHIPKMYSEPDFYGNILPVQKMVINTPPAHAKSTTITTYYALYQICRNWNVRIGIISKGEQLAGRFLSDIKEYLISPQYSQLQEDFAPQGGFRNSDKTWAKKEIAINGRSSVLKEPTVSIYGIGSSIYGARLDYIFVDDAVDTTNANQYDAQIRYINDMVVSRLEIDTGKLLIVGTRISNTDMYSALLNDDNYGGESPYVYFAQPAVLEYSDRTEDWKTLWPWTNIRPPAFPVSDTGLYPRWDGIRLEQVRNGVSQSSWSRIYQQEQVSEDTTFKPEDVRACIQPRGSGVDALYSVRPHGVQGLTLIAGLDPASSGFTACVLMGLDSVTGDRYIIDIHNKANMKPAELRDLIKDWTQKYRPSEFRIERNGFQGFLASDPELLRYTSQFGTKIVPHLTHLNKTDPIMGVMAMSALFESKSIHLPDGRNGAVRTLVEQLTTWMPDQSQKRRIDDIIMALWFCEIRAIELMRSKNQNDNFMKSSFHTAGDISKRYINTP